MTFPRPRPPLRSSLDEADIDRREIELVIADRIPLMFLWRDYTPTWSAVTTAPAIGNGTISGKYIHVGRWCTATIRMVPGSTTTFGAGTYTWSLPVPSKEATATVPPSGIARAKDDTDNTNYIGQASIVASVVRVRGDRATVEWAPSTPFTWAASDILELQIAYETA